jgi:hypothetical protein
MATIVANTGIKREKGWLYYVDKQGDVSRTRMARGGGKVPRGRPQKVAKCGIDREDGFLYFIDKRGNVSKVRMARSARRGRKPARRSTARRSTARRARRTARRR